MRTNFLPEVPAALAGRVTALLPASIGGSAARPEQDAPAARRLPAGPADRLALAEVRGNLTITASTVTVWFTLGKQVWPFRSDAEREAAIISSAEQFATLAGYSLSLRRTTVPFNARTWAKNLTAAARPLADSAAPIDAVDAARITEWADSVIAGNTLPPDWALEQFVKPAQPAAAPATWQNHLDAAVARLEEADFSDARTQLGVSIPRPTRLGRPIAVDAALAALADPIARVAENVAGPGLAARPSTHEETLWLIYRSVGLGLTPPSHLIGDVGAEDIGEFADAVEVSRGAHSATTQIVDRRTGQTVHVAVLTMGRMEPLDIPQSHEPWAHLSAQLGFDVEWSSRVIVLAPQTARRLMGKQLLKIRSQITDYGDHGEDVPLDLERLAGRAMLIEDQMDTALAGDATRVHGYHRMAVWDATRDGALAKARELIRFYQSELKAQVVHAKGQFHTLREFIPGEPTVDIGYLRRQPVKMFASAVPQATAAVGDGRGDYIGQTATSGTLPVMWDPHFPMEIRDSSGVAVLISEPGGGKSTLMGAVGYMNARRGVQVTLMDPSGPLARLAKMPELRDHTRVVDLVGSERGTLAPYAMIPTPRRASYPAGPNGDREHDSEIQLARAERFALALDILQMLLPPTVMEDRATIVALRAAVRTVPPEETSTLDDVVAQLYATSQNTTTPDALQVAASTAADLLTDMVQMPMSRMFFGRPPAGILDTDATLTIITMAGLQLPDLTVERRYWSMRQQLAVPMLHCANLLAVRRCYGGPMTSRKLVGLDEAHFMAGWDSGRAFLIRLARDSRKWNLAALVASQNPKDILDFEMQNLVSTVFAGRITDDPEVAAEALRLLGITPGTGYEATLAGLSQIGDTDSHDRLGYREFVMRDVNDRVQKIRVDVSWIPGLLAALNTTPGAQ
jgi:hypothetical protein